MRDFKRLQQDPPQGVNGSPNHDNIMIWNAVIFGPDDTAWDGGEAPQRPLVVAAAQGERERHQAARTHACLALLTREPQGPSASRSSSQRTTQTRRPS